MFVQTHFQRARHLATASHHDPRHQLESDSHSSASHHRNHHNQQQQRHNHNQRDPSNHANHKHGQRHCEHSPQSARARANQRAQATEGKDEQRARDRAASIRASERDQRSVKILEYLHHQHQSHHHEAPCQHSRHAHLRRNSEFDEISEQQHEKEAESRRHQSHRQQMNSANRAQITATERGECSLPVGASAGIPAGGTGSSTTLRLRSVSLSKLGSHQSTGDASGRNTRLVAGESSAKVPESEQVIRLRSPQAARGVFRVSSRPARRGGRSFRLERGRRTIKSGHIIERQLERVLTALIGPAVIVGRSLTNKIFASDLGPFERDAHQDAASTKDEPAASSQLKLGALITPITQTLHCLILFLVNFLQFQWQTLRHFLARLNTEKVYPARFDAADDDARANAMRAQRRQWPPKTAGAGAYSFDAARTLAPHEFARVDYAPPCEHQHSRHQPPVWTQPMQHAAVGHVHRHNHAACPTPAPHQVRDTFVSPAIGRYRSLDCDVHEPSGPYANHRQQPTEAPFVGQQQQQRQQVVPPTRGNNQPDASQMWKWHTRRTVDGYPPGEEQTGLHLLVGGSFEHHSADWNQPGHLHAHQSHGFPARMPHRQRLASISSPTLSDYDGLDCWPGLEQPAVAPQPVPFGLERAAYQPDPSQAARNCGPPVSAPPRRQLPVPPTQGVHPAHPSSLDSNPARLPDRRLSSIMGSDSELYTARRDGAQPAPTGGANCNSSDDCASVSSASRLRANANLMRFQLGKQAACPTTPRRHQLSTPRPPAPSPMDAAADSAADRRRFARQASDTSAAKPASGQRAAAGNGARRAHGPPPKLPHQFNSLQADSPRHTGTAGTANVSQLKAPSRLTKSDTESKGGGRSPSKVEGQPARTGSGDQPRASGRPTSAPKTSAKSLAAGGKSRSVASAHPSPIGVLGKAVSLAGAKRRLGFKQKGGLNSLSVHRSEEYFPAAPRRDGPAGGSGATTASNSLNSDSCEVAEPSSSSSASRWLGHFGATGGAPDPRVCFVEGLGAGQIASRQALVSPYLGDIQVSLSDRRGMLEVEVIRVRQLQAKPGAKRLPSPYVKVYLMRNKKCAAKFKTRQLQQTLDPLYQQLFIFRDSDYSNCVLQIIVWADYGKKDRKSLMGIVQIHLNDLDMSRTVVIGWYKLFNAPSMVAATASSPSVASSSKALRQTLSSTKLGDLATIQKQQRHQPDLLELPPVE